MPKFNLYSAWMDPVFYVWAAVFAAALVGMIYSIRKYVELKNASFDEDDQPAEAAYADVPVVEDAAPRQEYAAEAVQQELPSAGPEEAARELERACADPACEPAAEEDPAAANRAETFVRGIYDGISGLDTRLRSIEESLAKGRVNGDFTVKFLEDILQDIDNLDKTKIKARLEYLVSDLKK
ncbi:MAG: hypothetical protein ACYC2I_06010 [Elusimicrobiales bacterium]